MELVNPLSSYPIGQPENINGVVMRGIREKQGVAFSAHGYRAALEDPTINPDSYGAMIRRSLRPLSKPTLEKARAEYAAREVPELPKYLIAEPTGQICGRRCEFCTINVMKRYNPDGSLAKPGMMKWETWIKLMREFGEWGQAYGCSAYQLGEPLDYLVKDTEGKKRDIADMVDAAKRIGKFKIVNLSTHGDIPADRFMRLLDCDLDDLIVSIDGAVASTYSANRPVTSGKNEGAFERTVERVEAFLSEKVKRGEPKPWIRLQIINKENTRDEIVPFIKRWIDTPGIDDVFCKALDSMRPWLGTKVVSDDEDAIKAARTADMPCQHIFAVASVVYTGVANACCHDAYTELTDGTNISNSTFREWWHGKFMTDLRAAHVSGNFPSVCASCREKDTWLGA